MLLAALIFAGSMLISYTQTSDVAEREAELKELQKSRNDVSELQKGVAALKKDNAELLARANKVAVLEAMLQGLQRDFDKSRDENRTLEKENAKLKGERDVKESEAELARAELFWRRGLRIALPISTGKKPLCKKDLVACFAKFGIQCSEISCDASKLDVSVWEKAMQACSK